MSNKLYNADVDITTLQAFPHINLKTNKLTTIPQITNAVSLELSSNDLTYLDYDMIRNMINLLHLILTGNDIVELIPMDGMQPITGELILKELKVVNNDLTSLNLTFLDMVPNLVYFNVDKNPISVVSPALNGHSNLDELLLLRNAFVEIDIGVFSSLTGIFLCNISYHILILISKSSNRNNKKYKLGNQPLN